MDLNGRAGGEGWIRTTIPRQMRFAAINDNALAEDLKMSMDAGFDAHPRSPLTLGSSNWWPPTATGLTECGTLNGPEGNGQKEPPFKPLQIMRATSGPWMGHRKRPPSALTTGSGARLAH